MAIRPRPLRTARILGEARAAVKANQEVVTYCAIGMRASLMYWAARSVGVPAHVYLGSWQDWSRNSANPIVR